jgi:hypothetical protein
LSRSGSAADDEDEEDDGDDEYIAAARLDAAAATSRTRIRLADAAKNMVESARNRGKVKQDQAAKEPYFRWWVKNRPVFGPRTENSMPTSNLATFEALFALRSMEISVPWTATGGHGMEDEAGGRRQRTTTTNAMVPTA